MDFSNLRMAGGGGAPVQLAVAKRWKEITGRVLSEGYGLTETSGAVSINRADIDEHTGTTGLPVPGTEVQIRDEVERALPQGAVGQVFVRGPQVMAGYWQRPDETAKVLRSDGWLATGDMGLITPEGYLKIVDRVKDMILVSGFNVYPNEIEDVVAMHPGVLEACAIGVPDENTRRGGEAVRGAQGSRAHRRVADPSLPREPHRLQGPAAHRVPRLPAQEPGGQDSAARAARGGQGLNARISTQRTQRNAEDTENACRMTELRSDDCVAAHGSK